MSQEPTSVNQSPLLRTTFILLLFCSVPAVGIAGFYLVQSPDDFSDKPRELILTLLLITGVAVLTSLLVVSGTLFRSFGIRNDDQPLGLPQGSIRAMIALMLLMIFAIVAVFFYIQLRTVDVTAPIEGITQDQLNALPIEQISRAARQDDNTYTIERYVQAPPASDDFAKQVLTAVSTLVVAIASFYFGAQSVSAARAATDTVRSIKIAAPMSPARMLTDQDSLPIQIETTPPGLAVSTVVAGTDATKLKKLTDWSYEFTRPDPAPTTPVSIVFQLSADPSALAVLRIDFEGTTEMPPEADSSAQPRG